MKAFFDPRRFLGKTRKARKSGRPNRMTAHVEQLEGRALLTLPTHGALATQLAHSDEYYTTQVIAPDYQKFLGRTPTKDEVNFYLGELHAGATDERLLAGFSGSLEFYQASGNTPASWVKAMYQNILGRQPTTVGPNNELDYYVNYLNNGGARNNVALGFAYSPEHEKQVITSDYLKDLNRSPTSTELSAGIQQLQGGVPNETLIASLVGSTEFSNLHDQADANFVRAAYLKILDRLPQPAELAYNVGYLEGTGPVNVPGSAVYNVSVSSSVNGGAVVTQTGIAGVVQLAPFGVSTTNAEDFGIELGTPSTATSSGSLLFASDRALFSVLDSSSSPQPLKLANTTVNPVSGAFTITVDPSVSNSGGQQNEFNLVTGGVNAIYLVNRGTVTLQFATGGASFSGTIRLFGHLQGSSQSVSYSAAFAGTLV